MTDTTKPSSKPNNGWTAERRKAQADKIRQWQPWQHSTGAKTAEGKATCAMNAYKGGYRQKLRELVKESNAILRQQRDMLDKLK